MGTGQTCGTTEVKSAEGWCSLGQAHKVHSLSGTDTLSGRHPEGYMKAIKTFQQTATVSPQLENFNHLEMSSA